MPQDNKDQTEGEFKIQPIDTNPNPQGMSFKDAAHKAHPGPAITQNMPAQEGTKEERQAKAKELNK